MALLAELTGVQAPTHQTIPPYASTSGGEAADLLALAGVTLDPWQRLVLDAGLGEKPRDYKVELGLRNGRHESDALALAQALTWSAGEIAMILSRQNGKNVVFEARELFGLFVLREPLILHTAHQFKTSVEAFKSITGIIENYDWFRRKVKRIARATGEEGIELVPRGGEVTGPRLRFLARSVASGRGFRAKTLILDEAYELGDDAMGALLPTLSAQTETQVWYGSSAGKPTSVQLGRIWRRIRRAAASGTPDPLLAGFEWAAELCSVFCPDECTEHDRIDDRGVWARTNPGLGIRHANGTMLTVESIEREFATLCEDEKGREEFARERLGVGTYPSDEAETWEVIAQDRWLQVEQRESVVGGLLQFAIDVGPDRRRSVIAAAGEREDGRLHVELVSKGAGTEWVVPRAVELWRKWRPLPFVVDPGSPAGSLIEPLAQAGVDVATPFTARDAAQAAAQFYDATVQGRLVHTGQEEVTRAVAGARVRKVGDAWAWDRVNASVDISPLVGVTLALWGLRKFGRPRLAPYDLEKSVG